MGGKGDVLVVKREFAEEVATTGLDVITAAMDKFDSKGDLLALAVAILTQVFNACPDHRGKMHEMKVLDRVVAMIKKDSPEDAMVQLSAWEAIVTFAREDAQSADILLTAGCLDNCVTTIKRLQGAPALTPQDVMLSALCLQSFASMTSVPAEAWDVEEACKWASSKNASADAVAKLKEADVTGRDLLEMSDETKALLGPLAAEAAALDTVSKHLPEGDVVAMLLKSTTAHKDEMPVQSAGMMAMKSLLTWPKYHAAIIAGNVPQDLITNLRKACAASPDPREKPAREEAAATFIDVAARMLAHSAFEEKLGGKEKIGQAVSAARRAYPTNPHITMNAKIIFAGLEMQLSDGEIDDTPSLTVPEAGKETDDSPWWMSWDVAVIGVACVVIGATLLLKKK